MLVKEVMNRNVIVLKPDMDLRTAARILAENKITGAPVVDEHGKLIGILTLKDILKAIEIRMESLGVYLMPTPFDYMEFFDFEIPHEEKRDVFDDLSSIQVRDVMEKRVHYVYEDDDIEDAIHLLAKKEVSRLPVVDKNGKVIGIVSRADIISALARFK